MPASRLENRYDKTIQQIILARHSKTVLVSHDAIKLKFG
jgi:hypothetical protein